MAISLALNGASFGGIVGVPLLVAGIGYFGFSGAMMSAAVVMIVLMVPVILIFVGRPPAAGPHRWRPPRGRAVADADPGEGFRDIAFLSVSALCAGAVRAGRLHRPPHHVSRRRDRARAGRGRGGAADGDGGGRPRAVLLRDRPHEPAAGFLISFVSQAVALLIVINVRNDIALIAACALFGFSVGNLITLPALIVQREFDPRSFGVLVSLITAINQITYAFGPA
jgi:hypothetical protein